MDDARYYLTCTCYLNVYTAYFIFYYIFYINFSNEIFVNFKILKTFCSCKTKIFIFFCAPWWWLLMWLKYAAVDIVTIYVILYFNPVNSVRY